MQSPSIGLEPRRASDQSVPLQDIVCGLVIGRVGFGQLPDISRPVRAGATVVPRMPSPLVTSMNPEAGFGFGV